MYPEICSVSWSHSPKYPHQSFPKKNPFPDFWGAWSGLGLCRDVQVQIHDFQTRVQLLSYICLHHDPMDYSPPGSLWLNAGATRVAQSLGRAKSGAPMVNFSLLCYRQKPERMAWFVYRTTRWQCVENESIYILCRMDACLSRPSFLRTFLNISAQ